MIRTYIIDLSYFINVLENLNDGNDDKVIEFSERTSERAVECARQRLHVLDGPGGGKEYDISMNFVDLFSNAASFSPGRRYHRPCYSKFADNTRITAAERRLLKRKTAASSDGARRQHSM